MGSGENFGFGQIFWVGAKILGLGENFRFVRKFWVRAKILGSGENFRFGAKILGWGENFRFGRVEKCDLYPTVAPALLFPNKKSVLMIVPRC